MPKRFDSAAISARYSGEIPDVPTSNNKMYKQTIYMYIMINIFVKEPPPKYDLSNKNHQNRFIQLLSNLFLMMVENGRYFRQTPIVIVTTTGQETTSPRHVHTD